MKASAIIVGAGSGTRLGTEIPKAFVQIGTSSMLARVLHTIGAIATVEEVVIAVPANMEKAARLEVCAVKLQIPVKIVQGGVERQDSVRMALALTSSEAELVVVHDAARPFAAPAMFQACIMAAARCGGAIVGMPVADTLKRVEYQRVSSTLPRAGLWQAQTPQVFRRDLLVRAHQIASREPTVVTDDAYLVERLGVSLAVVEGSNLNMKITTPDDLMIAQAIARFGFPR